MCISSEGQLLCKEDGGQLEASMMLLVVVLHRSIWLCRNALSAARCASSQNKSRASVLSPLHSCCSCSTEVCPSENSDDP